VELRLSREGAKIRAVTGDSVGILVPQDARRIYKGLWFVNKKTQYGVNMGHYIVCLVTIGDMEKAIQIARLLVEKKLAACANIIPEIRSIYFWKGQVCDDTERLMIIKTRDELYEDLEKTVKELHPYEVPEIVCLRLDRGLPDYLRWIDDCTAL
jgi:periplasmic divalent cation tolerance protein